MRYKVTQAHITEAKTRIGGSPATNNALVIALRDAGVACYCATQWGIIIGGIRYLCPVATNWFRHPVPTEFDLKEGKQ